MKSKKIQLLAGAIIGGLVAGTAVYADDSSHSADTHMSGEKNGCKGHKKDKDGCKAHGKKAKKKGAKDSCNKDACDGKDGCKSRGEN